MGAQFESTAAKANTLEAIGAGGPFANISGRATSVEEALRTRHSVRQFAQRSVEPETLQELFGLALRTPSWKNSQPWKVHVLTGPLKETLANKLTAAATAGQPNPDFSWPGNYPASAKKRMFELGMRIYEVAGIERKDKRARDAFMLRNFSFFGAPVAVFITTEFDENFYTAIDLGCFLQTIMLLARTFGLGTCPQAALGAFPDVVREHLQLPAQERVVCGLSLGYPLEGSQLNEYHTPREAFADLVRFHV